MPLGKRFCKDMKHKNFYQGIETVKDSSHYPVREMVEAVNGDAGYEGEINYIPTGEAIRQMGDMAEALAMDQLVQSEKARRLLGWQAHHDGFIPDIHTYFRSWLAYHGD
ncbi:hypothetical protein GF337_19400 [candidate division KSB1 bacterium]|nr:hypothetical protein [candidate division KSB1 bacterium]